MSEGQGNVSQVMGEGNNSIPVGNDDAARGGSSITRPSYSPLTAADNDNSRLNSTGVFEVMEAAVGAARSQMLQMMRSEMQVVVGEAVRVALSNPSNGSDSRNNVDWPRDMPMEQNIEGNGGNPNREHYSNTNRERPEDRNRSRDNGNRYENGGHQRYHAPYPELFKWGIKYDGTSRTMLVEDFIFRVEKLQKSYNCPWGAIMDGFHHLLEGQAARWYWDHIRDRPGINWNNLKLDIVRKFQQFQSNMDVLRRMMDRFQMREEKSNDYIDAIISLRNQLREPLPDYQVVDIIKKNLKPRIASLIFATQIFSIEHLRGECRKAEDLLEHEYHHRSRLNPVNRTVNELAWDFSDMNETVEEIRRKPIAKPNQPLNKSKELTQCWNCKASGHMFKKCTSKQRSLFCYRCGSPGVISPQCAKCRPENRNSSAISGESRSTQTID